MKKYFPLIFMFLFISCYHSVTLHVSSQSSVPGTELGSPVDIQVLIDEEEIVNDEFYTYTGHSWMTYNLNLSSGTHTIIVKSNLAGLYWTQHLRLINSYGLFWIMPVSRISGLRFLNTLWGLYKQLFVGQGI